jgi:hypothetical protein
MRGIRFVICLVFGLSAVLVGCESLTISPTGHPGPTDPAKATPPDSATAKPSLSAKPTATTGVAKNLRQALDEGLVSVDGTGDSLQSLDLEVSSQTDLSLELTIPAGTLLEPGAAGTQRMVVLWDDSVSLAARSTETISLDVACVEMHRDQPTSDDSFTVLEDEAAPDLALLLATPGLRDATRRVTQFAVWTITNNPKRNDYVGLTSGFDIFGSGPDDEEIAAIRDLFDAAGIDTGNYRALR